MVSGIHLSRISLPRRNDNHPRAKVWGILLMRVLNCPAQLARDDAIEVELWSRQRVRYVYLLFECSTKQYSAGARV